MKSVNAEAELQAVKTLLDTPQEIRHLLLSRVREEYFGYEPAKEAFKRIALLIGRGKERQLGTSKTFANHPSLSDDCKTALRGKAKAVKKRRDVESLITQLEIHWKVRQLLGVSQDMLSTVSGDQKVDRGDLQELIARTGNSLLSMQLDFDSNEGLISFGVGSDKSTTRYLDDLLNGSGNPLISSGIDYFDEMTGGFGRTDLVSMGANRGGFKSGAAINMAKNQYLHANLNVAYLSYELSKSQAVQRHVSCVSGVPFSRIRKAGMARVAKKSARMAGEGLSPVDHQRINVAMKKFIDHGRKKNCRFDIIELQPCSAAELMARLLPMKYDVWYVDYLSFLKPNAKVRGEQHEILGQIAKELKAVAKACNIVIVNLVQMLELDGQLKVKFSRAVEDHSDYVWLWKYGDEERNTGNIIQIDQTKARNSEAFKFHQRLEPECMRMHDHRVGNQNAMEPERPADRDRDFDDDDRSEEKPVKKKKKKKSLKMGM